MNLHTMTYYNSMTKLFSGNCGILSVYARMYWLTAIEMFTRADQNVPKDKHDHSACRHEIVS